MKELDRIAAFQEALFEIFDRDVPPQRALDELKADPRAACYLLQLNGWDPHMVSVAQQLLKKWGVRQSAPNTAPLRGEGL